MGKVPAYMDPMLSLLALSKEDFFMFYDVVVNDWGETTYVPTTLGNVMLILLIAALLVGAVLLAGRYRRQSRLSVRQLAFCAMTLALGTILSISSFFPFHGAAPSLCFPCWSSVCPGTFSVRVPVF